MFLILIVYVACITYVTSLMQGMHICVEGLCGKAYWGAQGVDAFLHLTLISQSFHTFPFTQPFFAGHMLSGYNYLLDLFGALVVWGVSFLHLPDAGSFVYFILLPTVWLVGMFHALLMLEKAYGWRRDHTTAVGFFIFLGSSLEYLFPLLHGHGFQIDGFGGPLQTINMQYSYALLVCLWLIYVMKRYSDSQRIWLSAVCVGLMMGLKFYMGVLGAVMMSVYYAVDLYTSKKTIIEWGKAYCRAILPMVCILIVVISIFYMPTQSASVSEPIFSFVPFALSEKLIEDGNRIPLPHIVQMRYALKEVGYGPRLIVIQLLTLVAYMAIQFGTRIIVLYDIYLRTREKRWDALSSALYSSACIGLVIASLFVQKGQWWNIIQFQYSALFLLSFPVAEAYMRIRFRFAKCMLIAGTIPFSCIVLLNFTSPQQARLIPDEELKAVHFLRNQEPGAVLTLPNVTPSHNLSRDPDTTYVLYFSQKPGYVSAPSILSIMGVDDAERRKFVKDADLTQLRKQVRYIYAYGQEKPFCQYDMQIRRSGKPIYTSKEVMIYILSQGQ